MTSVGKLKLSNIAYFVKKTGFDDKLKNLKKKLPQIKHLLAEDELKKLQTFDSSLFFGQGYFFNDGLQLYLIFQPLYYTLKTLSNSEKVIWKSKGLSAKELAVPTTADNNLLPTIKQHVDSKFCLVLKESC